MPSLLKYVLSRFAIFLLNLWGAFTLAFIFFNLIPGDPVSAYLSTMEQNYSMSFAAEDAEAMVAAYKKMLGYDGTMAEQYWRYLSNVLLRFDFGPSVISFPTPAKDHILRYLPWTLWLLGISTLLSWGIGFFLGGVLGVFRNSPVSKTLTNISLVISPIPPYFTALFALFLLGYWIAVLPTSGAYSPRVERTFSLEFLLSAAKYAIMPAMAVVLVGVAGTLISTRSLVITILGDDYLHFAEAKGLRRAQILYRYVLRNAMLPQVTALALSLGFAISGFYLVEIIFKYPGMGTLFLTAVSRLDFNTIRGILLMNITVVLAATFLIDLCLPLIDPRVRLTGN